MKEPLGDRPLTGKRNHKNKAGFKSHVMESDDTAC